MQKDVIYIDVEDDITAIIGRVKDSKEKIVALVPPKRIGAIQSAVNLKLVHRAAEQADKRLVIISNNAALMALAGSAGIPVAKNLQSRPEMAEIPALDIDDGDDVIDGESLPELSDKKDEPSDTAPVKDSESTTSAAKDTPVAAAKNALGSAASAVRGKAKIPNFDSFRKKLFIGIAAGVILIGFLVWAIVFAPQAKIIVSARASDAALNTQVKIADAVSTNLKEGTIKSVTKTTKKDIAKPFTATGKKDVGTKATGTVQFYCDSLSSLTRGVTISAGTQLASTNGKTYTVDSSVSLSVGSGGSGSAGITATANGESYNGTTGTMTGSDLPRCVSATVKSSTSGGTDKTATVVQKSDVDAVSGELASQSDADSAKKELASQLGDGYILLDASFKTDTSGVKASPAIGAEAPDGKGNLSGSVNFSVVAVQKSEVGKFLDAYFAQQIDGKPNQKVYGNGINGVGFTNVTPTEGGYKAVISTNGKIGPKIEESALKEYAKGKRFGEIQDHVKQINGVENVDVKLSPFWVTSTPNDVKKIQVEFRVDGK